MTSWLVRDRDGRKVGMFDCNGSSKARMEAFRLLVAKGKAGGKLLKETPGKPEDVCWIDVREGTYRIIDPGTTTPYNDIDEQNGFVDETTGEVDPSRTSGKMLRVTFNYNDPKHSIPDPGEAPLYEFSDERLPKSFPIWGVRRLVSCS